MFKYKDYWIKYHYYYTKKKTLYDISYTIYNKNGKFITNIFNETESQLLEDIDRWYLWK